MKTRNAEERKSTKDENLKWYERRKVEEQNSRQEEKKIIRNLEMQKRGMVKNQKVKKQKNVKCKN